MIVVSQVGGALVVCSLVAQLSVDALFGAQSTLEALCVGQRPMRLIGELAERDDALGDAAVQCALRLSWLGDRSSAQPDILLYKLLLYAAPQRDILLCTLSLASKLT